MAFSDLEFQSLLDRVRLLEQAMDLTHAKLDSDGGVSDNDYASALDVVSNNAFNATNDTNVLSPYAPKGFMLRVVDASGTTHQIKPGETVSITGKTAEIDQLVSDSKMSLVAL